MLMSFDIFPCMNIQVQISHSNQIDPITISPACDQLRVQTTCMTLSAVSMKDELDDSLARNSSAERFPSGWSCGAKQNMLTNMKISWNVVSCWECKATWHQNRHICRRMRSGIYTRFLTISHLLRNACCFTNLARSAATEQLHRPELVAWRALRPISKTRGIREWNDLLKLLSHSVRWWFASHLSESSLFKPTVQHSHEGSVWRAKVL